MVGKKIFLSCIFIILIFISLNFVFGGILDIFSSLIKTSEVYGNNCGDLFGNYSGCMSANSSCRWMNNSGAFPMYSFCPINSTNYNSTSLSMYVGGSSKTYMQITGNLLINAGCCEMKSGGGGSASMGCMRFNGNKTGCINSNSSGCSWKPNEMNQNSFCFIKKIGDWGPSGAISNIDDVGCCENQGCWAYKGNQSLLGSQNCTNVLDGVCTYSVYGSGCPEGLGCCSPKSCSEVTTQTKCEQLIQLGSPCAWSGGVCSMMGGGGFGMYNSTDSCMSKGGWWNGTGCAMPTGTSGGSGGGGGGFMYAQEAKCWFADNKQAVCQNVSGCVYCSDSTTQLLNASSGCYNAPSASCKGHESRYTNWNGTASINITDINKSSMICGDLRTKRICNCGPLPNCQWTNSSTDVGNYCSVGMKSDSDRQMCQPPAMFCEDVKSKNNQTLCNLLASDYMMPCKWDTTNNCSFNNIAVFGGGTSGGGSSVNYNSIASEISCIAAGGTWKSSYYEDSDGSFKQDSWCEKGAMFDFSKGQAFANKGNCNTDCWACEFNSTGGSWGTGAAGLANASAACLGSAKGICRFKNDSNAPNRLGWCDYPKEMEYGSSGDCNGDCKACELMGMNSTTAQTACSGSSAGCTWVNDTTAPRGGFCMSSSKKSCSNDCSSCYSQISCSNSSYHPSVNCSWDNNFKFCKTFGFTGEICFNGIDDDNDGKMDCGDSDCSYDQFCGGASMGSGAVDCKRIFVQASCVNNRTSGGANCTWVNMSAGGMIGQSYCDFPGSDCWMYESSVALCANGRGCIYRNSSGGYPVPGVKIDSKAFSGFCDMNKTKSNICYNSTNRVNSTLCNAAGECMWISDSYMMGTGGRCEFKPFAMCGNISSSGACADAGGGGLCGWVNNSFSSSGVGFCQPNCAGKNQTGANGCTGFCSWKSTSCEPEGFGGMESGGPGAGGIGGGFGCHMHDGNQTGCISQNMSCAWNSFSQNSSQGICMPKGEYSMVSGMDQSPPKMLGKDAANDINIKEIDITDYGMKEAPTSLSFGIMVTNITNAAVCRGYYIGGMSGPGMGVPVLGNGTTTTKFFWYLDTNKNTTDGCNAVPQTGSNLTGFEFFMKYVVSLDNQTVSEQKSLYRCVGGEWIMTNVPLTSNRQMLCSSSMPNGFLGGVMMMIDKENLKSFTEYNQTVPVRVFVASANASYGELSPQDSASVGYYTPGSADFKFVDCSDPTSKDTKCKNFQKYGFNLFEDCKNGKDDDSDGSTDCSDLKCKFVPSCASGSAFNFVADANDNQAPTVTFSQVDVLRDSGFVKFDTDEPANGTLSFYYNDSSCNSLNATIIDIGDPSISFDNYKPFHMAALDLNNLGYSLSNGTIYYYKTIVCDPSSNCASSACQNFTTNNEAVKNFIFRMDLPPGYNVTIPQLNYSGNFTKVVGGVLFDVGIKTNTSISRNINITINCGSQSLTFVGADILKPKTIDMENAFVCDTGNNVLGMNSTSKSWNQLIGDIGMGGQSDYIKLNYPVSYSSSNTITWCDDLLSNCSTVNDYANCSDGGSSTTSCKIPTSLGFSAYQITVPSSGVSTPSSGGGGGGGASTATYTLDSNQLKQGYSASLKSGDKFKLNISNEYHYVTANVLGSSTVSINVTSTLQQATLSVGEEKKFDVNSDNIYDLLVRLNSIDGINKKANLTVKSISEKISSTKDSVTGNAVQEEQTTTQETQQQEQKTELNETRNYSFMIWLIFAIIVIAILIIIWYIMNRKKNLGYRQKTKARYSFY